MNLAEALGGEVVGTDSMQAYKGMNVGTATPTLDERRGIPHHMLDMWDIQEAISVVDFRDRARVAIDDIRARGKVPIVVGGSGLYVRAVTDDMKFPTTDPEVRRRWRQRLEVEGAQALHAELAIANPAAAQAILPTNGRRIVRALEVQIGRAHV